MPTKAQSRRGSRQSGKYKDRFHITERNKARREKARLQKADSPKTAERAAKRLLRNLSKGIPRNPQGPKFTNPATV